MDKQRSFSGRKRYTNGEYVYWKLMPVFMHRIVTENFLKVLSGNDHGKICTGFNQSEYRDCEYVPHGSSCMEME